MADNSWMNHPAWTEMEPEKKAIMEELLIGCRGKKVNESANLIMAAMTMLQEKEPFVFKRGSGYTYRRDGKGYG